MESNKSAMTTAEIKRKSRGKQLEKDVRGGKVDKAIQNKQTKQQEQMTPVGLKGFRKTETAYIKAL